VDFCSFFFVGYKNFPAAFREMQKQQAPKHNGQNDEKKQRRIEISHYGQKQAKRVQK